MSSLLAWGAGKDLELPGFTQLSKPPEMVEVGIPDVKATATPEPRGKSREPRLCWVSAVPGSPAPGPLDDSVRFQGAFSDW